MQVGSDAACHSSAVLKIPQKMSSTCRMAMMPGKKTEVDQQTVIYMKGYVLQFEKWMQDNLTIMAGIFIDIALLQILGIYLIQNLVTGIEAVRASW